MILTVSKLLVLIAAIIFILASLGAWPSIAAYFEPLALGLFFLAASFLLP